MGFGFFARRKPLVQLLVNGQVRMGKSSTEQCRVVSVPSDAYIEPHLP